MKRIFAIYEQNFDKSVKKLDLIKKKANKLNIPFDYIVENERMEMTTDEDKNVFYNKVFDFVVTGESVTINGYEIVARMESVNGSNIISKINETVDIPVMYYDRVFCDHCNSRKNYRYSILIQNTETKEFKQVGKTCLKEYLNYYTVESSLDFYEMLETLEFEYVEPTHFHDECYIDLSKVINITLQAVKDSGYVKSDDYTLDTKHIVCDSIWHYGSTPKYTYKKEFKEEEETIINHFRNLENINSEYLHNLKSLMATDYTMAKYINFVISSVPSYKNMVAREVAKQRKNEQRALSEFVGAIGERNTYTDVVLYNCFPFNTQWGVSYLYVIATDIEEKHHVLVWFSSSCYDVDNGDTFDIIGTIKEHKEYQGTKQTALTRCKITNIKHNNS